MKDDDFKLLRGFEDKQTDGQMDRRTYICDCRVTFATEKRIKKVTKNSSEVPPRLSHCAVWTLEICQKGLNYKKLIKGTLCI